MGETWDTTKEEITENPYFAKEYDSLLRNFAPDFAKAQAEIKHAVRDAENPFYKSSYADLKSVVNACRDSLVKYGFSVIQTTRMEGDKIILCTILLHKSGERVEGEISITPMREKKDVGWIESRDPQSIGSAITYARRYALAAIVGVATEDDDAEAASGRGAAAGAGISPAQQHAPQGGSVLQKGVEKAPVKAKPGELTDDDKRKKLIDFAAIYCIANKVRMEAAIIDWSKFHSKDRKTGEYMFLPDGSPKYTYKSDVRLLEGKWLHVTYENGKRWLEEYEKKHPPGTSAPTPPPDDQEIPPELFPEE